MFSKAPSFDNLEIKKSEDKTEKKRTKSSISFGLSVLTAWTGSLQ